MAKKGFAAGASASLNKTITAVMEFLDDEGRRPSKQFRAFLHKKLADSNEKWFRRGFNRGHKESLARFLSGGKVPSKLTYEGIRTLFVGHKRKVKLKSRIAAAVKPKKKRRG